MQEVSNYSQQSNGAYAPEQQDSVGNKLVSLNTLIAGEDLVNDLIKTEQRFNLTNISTGVGTTVKTGSGLVHSITINNPGTAWEVDVYDGTASSGTSIGKIRSAAAPSTLRLDGSFATGLFIDTVKGTAVGDLTVTYR
jgi:hypothetical protein